MQYLHKAAFSNFVTSTKKRGVLLGVQAKLILALGVGQMRQIMQVVNKGIFFSEV